MIMINTVIGNIRKDHDLHEKCEEMSSTKKCEVIRISRLESQRIRMRKTSDKGSDIAITLSQGSQLHHGDVLFLDQERMIIVEREPEDVAVIEIRNNLHEDDMIEIPVKVGHTIGNLHRPIKLDGNKIYFPIQADTEIETFKKLFHSLQDHIEIRKSTIVFEPDEGMHVHEH
jgi:urease accessory protein